MVRCFLIFVVLLLHLSCNQEKSLDLNANYEGASIVGLASVIRMNSTAHEVVIEDYFSESSHIDSIRISSGFAAELNERTIRIVASDTAPNISILNCWDNGIRYDLVCFKSKKESIVFRLNSKAQKVELAGDMNNWSPQMFTKDGENSWSLKLNLTPGKYQYQLVFDDEWQIDASNKLTIDNGNGGLNSLLNVGRLVRSSDVSCNTHVKENSISFDFMNFKAKPIVLWENFELQPQLTDAYNYKIPAIAKDRQRSHIRVWYSDDNGNVNDFMLPLHYGEVIVDPELLSRNDKHANILYFMLVDRFHNGNHMNDEPLSDPDVDTKANYYGGDIKGILEKLEEGYFKSLGVNTIWLSPITQNPLHAEIEYPAPHRKYSGYHGYWPISLTQIDNRLGKEADLKTLVKTAHDQKINVILDYVSNHVHDENPIIRDHPEWQTKLILEDGRKNIRLWDEHRLTTWFDLFLPTLDFSIPEVIKTISDSAFFMLEHYNLDGFRHDATKHIPEAYWRALTKKIKKNCKRAVYQIGETFGSRELIGSYVGSGQMDGQFDFNLYFDLRSVLARDNSSFKQLDESVHTSIQYYGTSTLMGNITGNHDIARFISYAGKSLKFSEDDKMAGWTREIVVEDTIGYAKLKLLTAFIMTAPGVPVIYYGDEIGMPGAGDPDNRKPMKFDSLSSHEQSVLDNTKELVRLRKKRMSLMYGSFKTEYVSDKVYAYSRKYMSESTLVILNNSADNQQVKINNKTYNLTAYSYKTLLNY